MAGCCFLQRQYADLVKNVGFFAIAARGFVAQVLPSETKRTRGRTEGVRVQSRDAHFNSDN